MIGSKTIEKVSTEIGDLLRTHADAIARAYDGSDKNLSISLGIKLETSEDGVKIQTQITFIEKKVKDGTVIYFDEKQMNLFK